jgi:hypothetical protein
MLKKKLLLFNIIICINIKNRRKLQKKKTFNNYHYYYCYKKIFEQILLQASSVWLDAHALGQRTPGTWTDGLRDGHATRVCPHFRLLPPGARAGRGPSMQTPSAGSPTPWVLGVDPTT